MKKMLSLLIIGICVTSLYGQNTDQLFLDGCNFVVEGKYKKAIKSFTDVLEEDTSFTYSYINRASVYALMGKHKKAISDLNMVINDDPTAEFAYETRGYELFNIKEYNKAIADFNRILKMNPENTFVNFPRGLAYYKLKDYNKAINDFEKAIAINEDGETYYFLALCYSKLEDNVNCCKFASKAKELEYHKSVKKLLKSCE